jgi:hypothetical protein
MVRHILVCFFWKCCLLGFLLVVIVGFFGVGLWFGVCLVVVVVVGVLFKHGSSSKPIGCSKEKPKSKYKH